MIVLKKRKVKDTISHMAIVRYLESLNTQPSKPTRSVAEVKSERMVRIIERDIDLIELQYRTTTVLLDRFEYVTMLPEMFERRMSQIIDSLKKESEADAEFLHRWKISFADELRRNVQSITSLNRELRENSKFMSDLREKAFEFKLWKEFTDLFIDAFRQRAPDACDLVLQDIAMNPRMQRIIEMQMKGETA